MEVGNLKVSYFIYCIVNRKMIQGGNINESSKDRMGRKQFL
jgi:hypothetical protein